MPDTQWGYTAGWDDEEPGAVGAADAVHRTAARRPGRLHVGRPTPHCVALTITLGPCLNYASP
ncbi:hypothetical protein GCM10010317_009550 [Streptomyces mirabilis]|nr:hypothetical protein GCM10010317_009550 [Streptomyces mirabilis]